VNQGQLFSIWTKVKTFVIKGYFGFTAFSTKQTEYSGVFMFVH